jgi:hypothetical protein
MMEKAASGTIEAALDLCRVVRDLNSEVLFFQIYGSMIALGIVEPKVYAEMTKKVDPRLWKMQKDYLPDMDDAIDAVKDDTGKIHLHKAISLAAADSVTGFCGMMIGLM